MSIYFKSTSSLTFASFPQDVLGERVKAFGTWQAAVSTLQKKREQRSRMELAGRIDRMGPLIEVTLMGAQDGSPH